MSILGHAEGGDFLFHSLFSDFLFCGYGSIWMTAFGQKYEGVRNYVRQSIFKKHFSLYDSYDSVFLIGMEVHRGD